MNLDTTITSLRRIMNTSQKPPKPRRRAVWIVVGVLLLLGVLAAKKCWDPPPDPEPCKRGQHCPVLVEPPAEASP